LDFKALTKFQSVALIAIIVAAAVVGSAAYLLLSVPTQSGEPIRIGISGDLDMPGGKAAYQGALLAVEQINSQGGILGRKLTVVAEDNDGESGADISVSTNALTRLITVDKADYVVASQSTSGLVQQDICAEHKKIFFSAFSGNVEYTQRVADNYDKYKYFFRIFPSNTTTSAADLVSSVLAVRNYTGFNKVAYLVQDWPSLNQIASGLNQSLFKNGFKVVYGDKVQMTTTDFTSSLAAIENSGAEILVPIFANQASVSLVKEWNDRQSPFVIWGMVGNAEDIKFWNLTQGKCDYISFVGSPIVAGYPFTNMTLATREAYISRWGDVPSGVGSAAYDTVRFILPEAIKRAGTTETEAVVKALEVTDVETSLARHFMFTSSHDVMYQSGGDPSSFFFQWQNGKQVPAYPEKIMEEAGATFKFPPWPGPWGTRAEAP
jgi:branched-chain amino acid transport system substrate-binding protein